MSESCCSQYFLPGSNIGHSCENVATHTVYESVDIKTAKILGQSYRDLPMCARCASKFHGNPKYRIEVI